MDRVPFVYDHPDIPELASKAFVMFLTALVPIVFGLFSGMMCVLYKPEYLPLVLLYIVPIIAMLFIARRKLDDMYVVARNRSLDEANLMFGRSMLTELMIGVFPSFILNTIIVLLTML